MKPRHIILLIADSLRWDSVYQNGGSKLPYIANHSTSFLQARSAGCWTLPATASMFTGLLPHEHRATSQTRFLREDVPTLAERLKDEGYKTHMITANIATTKIFGLERGFDVVKYAWAMINPKHHGLHGLNELLVLIGKPRLRKMLLSPKSLTGQLTSDLRASRVWLQMTVDTILDTCRKIIKRMDRQKKNSFFFLNLMETHFPYHISNMFEFAARGFVEKAREAYSMYHLLNQSYLKRNKFYLDAEMLENLRERQRYAWELISSRIDEFVQEMKENHQALVVFGSDHGDNFGEDGWQYHFSNVTDAGNRVPLFWLDPEKDGAQAVDTPVSCRDLYGSILLSAGLNDPSFFHIAKAPERSQTVMESYWYNNQGKTLPKYRFNQFAFVADSTKYVFRKGRWLSAPVTTKNEKEESLVPLPKSVHPLQEKLVPPENEASLRKRFAEFTRFSSYVMNLKQNVRKKSQLLFS